MKKAFLFVIILFYSCKQEYTTPLPVTNPPHTDTSIQAVIKDTLNLIFAYGQSLSDGGIGFPPVSTTPIPNLYTFTQGPRMEHYDDSLHAYDSLSPLIEGRDGMPETPCSGLGRYWVRHHSGKLLIASAGQPGKRITELLKGSIYYNRLIRCVREAYKIAQENGWVLKIQGVVWMQGEQNMTMAISTYINYLQQLRGDFNSDVAAITGQNNIDFWVYQMASFNISASQSTNMPLALLEVSELPGFHFGTTMYQWKYNENDNVHLFNGLNYKLCGATFGRSIINTEVALKPTTITISKLVLNVAYNNTSPLTLDSQNVSKVLNYGYRVFDSNNKEVFPSNVYLRADTLRLAFKGITPKAGWVVTYGLNGTKNKSGYLEGARGNVRDVTKEPFESDTLRNWSVMFKKQVQ